MSYELTHAQHKLIGEYFDPAYNKSSVIRNARSLARAIAEPMAERIKVLEDALRVIKDINGGEYMSIDSRIDEALRGGKDEK